MVFEEDTWTGYGKAPLCEIPAPTRDAAIAVPRPLEILGPRLQGLTGQTTSMYALADLFLDVALPPIFSLIDVLVKTYMPRRLYSVKRANI